jgi:hypothetical protein
MSHKPKASPASGGAYCSQGLMASRVLQAAPSKQTAERARGEPSPSEYFLEGAQAEVFPATPRERQLNPSAAGSNATAGLALRGRLPAARARGPDPLTGGRSMASEVAHILSDNGLIREGRVGVAPTSGMRAWGVRPVGRPAFIEPRLDRRRP